MSETYLRQWSMLRLVPRAPRKVDAATLQNHLQSEGYDINLRSIQRDLKTLSGVFPLTCDERTKPYGWSFTAGYVFDIPGMDAQTALTFALTAQFLEPLLPRSCIQYLKPHFDQAQKVLKQFKKPGYGEWLDKVRILSRGQRLLSTRVAPDNLNVVYEALLTDKQVKARYLPREESEAREYDVNPLGLVFRDAVVYLVCTLWNYEDIKQLALHRINHAELLDTGCRKPKGFSLERYIASGAFGYPVSKCATHLRAFFDSGAAFHLAETPLSHDQALKNKPDGRVQLDATVTDSQELRWWLLGFGDLVEVIKPKYLRDEFKAIFRKMARAYT